MSITDFKHSILPTNLKTKKFYACPAYSVHVDPDYTESDYSITLHIKDVTLYMDINGYVYHGERNGVQMSQQQANQYLDAFYKSSKIKADFA